MKKIFERLTMEIIYMEEEIVRTSGGILMPDEEDWD